MTRQPQETSLMVGDRTWYATRVYARRADCPPPAYGEPEDVGDIDEEMVALQIQRVQREANPRLHRYLTLHRRFAEILQGGECIQAPAHGRWRFVTVWRDGEMIAMVSPFKDDSGGVDWQGYWR